MNIRMLQMSLVEEVVSFSALDRIKELMCVSVFCACLDSITFTLLANNQLDKPVEPVRKVTVDAALGKRAVDHGRGKKLTPAPVILREKLHTRTTVENPEQAVKLQKEDAVGSLNIARIHFQLRRLKQKANMINSRVILTTIPEPRSKVTFTFTADEPTEIEDLVGFIMVECGLEDLNLKGMWRCGYSPTPTIEDTLHLQQAETLLQDVQRKVTFYNEVSDDLGEDSAAEPVQRQKSDPLAQASRQKAWRESTSNKYSDPSPGTEGEDEVDGGGKADASCTPLEGNASSGVLQFQTVWFNFAAPPSKKRNTESTR